MTKRRNGWWVLPLVLVGFPILGLLAYLTALAL